MPNKMFLFYQCALRDPDAACNVRLMPSITWILAGILFAFYSAGSAEPRAHAPPAYSPHLDVADPPVCLARRAVESGELRPREQLDAVLRHGLVDLVPPRLAVMLKGLDSVAPQMLYSEMSSAMRQAGRQSLLAAIALLAAARHEIHPFADPSYLGLAHEANDDPQIPVLAVAVWVKFVGMNGWPDDFRVTHVGLPAIWARAMDRKQQDAALLARIACDLGALQELKSGAREFLTWYARRPQDLTTDQ